jgi:hypothetical protein
MFAYSCGWGPHTGQFLGSVQYNCPALHCPPISMGTLFGQVSCVQFLGSFWGSLTGVFQKEFVFST